LMVSLIINAALAFAGKWMSSLLPATSVMLQLAAELASLGVSAPPQSLACAAD
jgi:hypothetical protein